ncbi:MAG: hypothetical protein AB8E82_17980 [Aureispira sp.]
MKKLWSTSTFLLLLISGLFFLSSFSSVPVVDVRDDNPPVEKTKDSRRKARLNKRYNRLSARFDKTTNTKQRVRLQKKIRSVERQQDGAASPVVGIIGLALGVISFFLFIAAIAALGAAARAALMGMASSTAVGGLLYVAGLVSATAGLVVSIVSLILTSTQPEKHNLPGFAIAGIIVGSIFMLILAIAVMIFYILA